MRLGGGQADGVLDLRRGAGRFGAAVPWMPVLLGVLVMVALLVAAVVRTADTEPVRTPTDLPPGPAVQLAAPDDSGFGADDSAPDEAPDSGVAAEGGDSTGDTPQPSVADRSPAAAPARPGRGGDTAGSRTPSRRDRSSPPAVSRPVAAPVTGAYRVIDTFSDSFIGEVAIANSSSGAAGWRVELRFGDDVGDLRTAWVEGSAQPTTRRSGQTYVFTARAAVAGGRTVPLRFQFDRSGRSDEPIRCMVNGERCRTAK